MTNWTYARQEDLHLERWYPLDLSKSTELNGWAEICPAIIEGFKYTKESLRNLSFGIEYYPPGKCDLFLSTRGVRAQYSILWPTEAIPKSSFCWSTSKYNRRMVDGALKWFGIGFTQRSRAIMSQVGLCPDWWRVLARRVNDRASHV